jgi:hypothetical protein
VKPTSTATKPATAAGKDRSLSGLCMGGEDSERRQRLSFART